MLLVAWRRGVRGPDPARGPAPAADEAAAAGAGPAARAARSHPGAGARAAHDHPQRGAAADDRAGGPARDRAAFGDHRGRLARAGRVGAPRDRPAQPAGHPAAPDRPRPGRAGRHAGGATARRRRPVRAPDRRRPPGARGAVGPARPGAGGYRRGRRRARAIRVRPARAMTGPATAQVVVPDMTLPPMTPTPCRAKMTPARVISDPAAASRIRVSTSVR